MKEFIFQAGERDRDLRIDKFLADNIADLSRSYLQKLIKEQQLQVNGKVVKTNYKVLPQDHIRLLVPTVIEPDILAEDIPLDILYEDQHLLVVNKPKGMVVHPSAGHYRKTLVNALLFHCRNELSSINGVMRPGIVHRIDRDTTGALVVCKNDAAHQCLSVQLQEHSITRKYRAIVWNQITPESGTVDQPIGRHPTDRKKMSVNHKNGKRAVTHYRVLQQLGKFSYIECTLETGRTHQIRVHMASIGHPLLGDSVYGSGRSHYDLQGQTLHALTLGFIHPATKEYCEFEAPLPAYFEQLLRKFS